MNKEDQFPELERPMGAFIDDQDDVLPVETRNGHYYHYEDVCKLLRRFKNQLSPAIGGEGEVLQDRSEAKPETPGPKGYRPDNQGLPQETTTQNIKTAEAILKEHTEAYAKGKVEYNLTGPGIISAMHAYAQQLIEADRKDSTKKANALLVSEGIYGYSAKMDDSILNRPLPKMI